MDDRIVLDKGGKRQLPQWMFAASAADHVKEKVKTDHIGNNNGNNSEELTVTQRRSRLKNREIKDKKEAFTEESSAQISSCQTTSRSRRKLGLPNDESGLIGRKCDKIEVNGDGAMPMLTRLKQKTKNSKIKGGAETEESTIKATDGSGLKKRKHEQMKESSGEAGPRSRRQKRKVKNSGNENYADDESTPKTDDEDLTVEDLMSIAEEYTGDADEDLSIEDLMSIAKEYVNENEQAASGKEKGGPKDDTVSMSKGSLSYVQVDNQSLRREETNSNCISIQETTIEDALPKVTMSGNPTQDMLDVFLGPLLKGTHKEKSVELIRDDMSFAHDLNKKNSSDPSGVQPVFTKKKSSLKDQVALLLD